MFYQVYEELCRLSGEAPSRAAERMGLNRATVTCWKHDGFCPRQRTLVTVARYFAVPVAYLTGEEAYPCPLCGGDAATHPRRHAQMTAAAATYGLCWHEALCRARLTEARARLLAADSDRAARLAAVRTALDAQFSRSVVALDFPPDHVTRDGFVGRFLQQHHDEDWLTAEEYALLCAACPPPTAGVARLPRSLFDDPPPTPAASAMHLPQEPYRLPVLGRIAAGAPIVAEEEVLDYLPVSFDPADYFALRIKGDSMVGAGIVDGAVVILRRQDTASDGEIAACLLDGADATLKRIRRQGDILLLCAENPAYAPIAVPLTAFAQGDARILGVAVEVRTRL